MASVRDLYHINPDLSRSLCYNQTETLRFFAGVAESVRFVYTLAIAISSIRVRLSVKSRRLSLLAATASLLGFPQFPARSPRRGPQPAVFNDFGPDPGTAGEIFPAIREFQGICRLASIRDDAAAIMPPFGAIAAQRGRIEAI